MPSTEPPLVRGSTNRSLRSRGRLFSRNRASMLEFCLPEIIPRSMSRLHRAGSKKNTGKARETTRCRPGCFSRTRGGQRITGTGATETVVWRTTKIAVDSEVLRATLAGPHAKVCPGRLFGVYR
jgi:hypothetical protein